MTRQKIPAAPLALGLAGLIPFVWGTLSLFIPALQEFGSAAFGARFVGPYVQVFYGAIILAFMSGVLWGFATKSSGREAVIGYGLSVLPALWAFFATGGGHSSAASSGVGTPTCADGTARGRPLTSHTMSRSKSQSSTAAWSETIKDICARIAPSPDP